jgi:hypothetical protein
MSPNFAVEPNYLKACKKNKQKGGGFTREIKAIGKREPSNLVRI